MRFDRRYRQDERFLLWAAAVLGAVTSVLGIFILSTKNGSSKQIPPEEVWAYIREEAPKSGIDPEFVYALAWAESSLRPRARSSVARGMMQLTKMAWSDTTDWPYRRAWEWQANVSVALDYLAFCKSFLEKNGAFSYPLLAASYRYGPYSVKKRKFDIAKIDPPKNEIYQLIFDGNSRPVAPPEL